ncbi:MAG: methyltransferase [Nanoarchaeota archaeon]|nr:methyltransferase [Nanoarchaeota archaeon]
MTPFYEPAEDSYLLQKWVKKLARGKVLDMGCSSGILARTAKESGAEEVVGVDVNPLAVKAANHDYKSIKFFVSDLFEKIREKFDLIIFNPPYLPKDDREPLGWGKVATTFEPNVFEKFLRKSKEHLRKSGKILLLLSSLTPPIAQTLINAYYEFRVLDEKKFAWETLYVLELT